MDHQRSAVNCQRVPNKQTRLMDKARARASFDPGHLTAIIHGSKEIFLRQSEAFSRVETALGTDDTYKLPRCYGNLDREGMYLEGLKAGRIAMEDGIKYKHDFFHNKTHLWAWSNSSPLGVSFLLFVPVIKQQASLEQIRHWLPLAESGKILGSYGQTELGHGSFVRGVETTATFHEEAGGFDLHSPSLTSIKFWPGGIGFTCSHSIVIARLIIKGIDKGVHAFMVQVRSLVDYTPLPGIEMGDIGLKMSYNGADNGFARFTHVHVPLSNMLSRYASVAKDGTYECHPQREKLLYGTMLRGRISLIHATTFQLAQATTIATRYSTVREQGKGYSQTKMQENAVINYKAQHERLLTLIAKSYAILFVSNTVSAEFTDLKQRQDNDDHSTLPFCHMLTAGFKAWATQTAADGAEDARKSCGGHGYMMISGLPEIVASVTASCTFEGENYVMWHQVAQYLMKAMASSFLPPDMAYLTQPQNYCIATGIEFLEHETIIALFQQRASSLIHEVNYLLSTCSRIDEDPWNEHTTALLNAARAHIELLAITYFHTEVSALQPSAMSIVLKNLVALFGLTCIISPTAINASSFISSCQLSHLQLRDIRAQVNGLLDSLLPDAIALTDAWGFSDASLCSAIGLRDGNVYERIMAWTKQLPINMRANENARVFQEGFREVIEPVLRAKL